MVPAFLVSWGFGRCGDDRRRTPRSDAQHRWVAQNDLVPEVANVKLDTGVLMEYASVMSPTPSWFDVPAVLFLHGSGRSCWVWREHWMPFVAKRGYHSFAPSLRGTGSSEPPVGENSHGKIPVDDYVRDLVSFVDQAIGPRRRLVVVGHSMGGLITMKLLETYAERFDGVALFCSVPPSGNSAMTLRFLFERGIGPVINISRGFVLGENRRNPMLNRTLYFGSQGNETDEYMQRFTERVARDSRYQLDVIQMNQALPKMAALPSGCARWMRSDMRALVVGAEKDYIVDQAAVQETATFLGSTPVILDGQSHDLMLSDGWQVGAETLVQWLDSFSA